MFFYKDKDGKLIENEDMIRRWKEYIEEMLNERRSRSECAGGT